MKALDLDAGGYRGTYKLIGGRPSLDLVNTVSWPGTQRAHDWLDSHANLRRWLQATGLPMLAPKHLDLATVVDLRATLADVLRPLAHGRKPPRKDIDDLNRRLRQANSKRIIDPSTLTWTWISPKHVIDVFASVLLDAADLVTQGNHDRLRHCPACDWLFEDQTRNGQRRWCDMADCGSRDKARRYYHHNN